jgi:hypothetical protein
MFIEEKSNFTDSVSTAQSCADIYFEAKCAYLESSRTGKPRDKSILYIIILYYVVLCCVVLYYIMLH